MCCPPSHTKHSRPKLPRVGTCLVFIEKQAKLYHPEYEYNHFKNYSSLHEYPTASLHTIQEEYLFQEEDHSVNIANLYEYTLDDVNVPSEDIIRPTVVETEPPSATATVDETTI